MGPKQPRDMRREIPKIAVGGKTICGQVRTENQDAFEFARLTRDSALIVVCDGVGGEPGGAEAAQAASRYISTYIQSRLALGVRQRLNLLQEVLIEVQIAFQSAGQCGLTTAIVALVRGEQLFYATLGDGELLVVFPDQMIQSLMAPHHGFGLPDNVLTAYIGGDGIHMPRVGQIHFPRGSMVWAMSDGAAECVPQVALQDQQTTFLKYAFRQGAESLCAYFLDAMERAKDPATEAWIHSDNLTLGLIATSTLAWEDRS